MRCHVFFCAMLFAGSVLAADLTWDGGAATDAWNDHTNWVGNTAVPNPAGGDTLYFDNTDLGNDNVLDQDYETAGVYYENSDLAQKHTTDVNGKTLTVAGDVRVGYAGEYDPGLANSQARIEGGTLQLGRTGVPGSIIVGHRSRHTIDTACTNNVLVIVGTVDFRNAYNIAAGIDDYAYYSGVGGTLDLSGATVVSNRIRANGLLAGTYIPVTGGHGGHAYGTVKLPESVTNIDVNYFWIGYGGYENKAGYFSKGTLDIGTSSQLKSVTARDGFRLGSWSADFGRIGTETITNFYEYVPTGLVLRVGEMGSPADMVLGNRREGRSLYNDTTGRLSIVNGRFEGWLDRLMVGVGEHAYGSVTGLLDLSTCEFVTDGLTNQLKANELIVGGFSSAGTYGNGSRGLLKIPASVTNIEVDILRIGSGGYENDSDTVGILDIGTNSALKVLTAKEEFALGAYAGRKGLIGSMTPTGFWSYVPTGLVLKVGTPASHANFFVGHQSTLSRSFAYRSTGALEVVNGRFEGYLDSLQVGANSWAHGGATGLVDLSTCEFYTEGLRDQLRAREIVIGGGVAGGTWGDEGYGTLRIPSSVSNIVAGSLVLGNGCYLADGESEGTLDIGTNSALKVLMATNAFVLGANRGAFGRIGTQTSTGFVEYLPEGLYFQVGTPGSPGEMRIADRDHQARNVPHWTTGQVDLVNGHFEGYLSKLNVGVVTYAYGGSFGLLDLSQSTVSFDGVPNRIKVDELIIGGVEPDLTYAHGNNAQGILRIPASVTNIDVGTLRIGYGGYEGGSLTRGTLDIGENSQLKAFTVRDEFILGADHANFGRIGTETLSGFVEYLPTGLVFSVGEAVSPAPMHLAADPYELTWGRKASCTCTGHLALANGTFRGYLAELKVASYRYYGEPSGLLDLSDSVLDPFVVTGGVWIGYSDYPDYGNRDAKGRVILPSGTASFSNALFVGDTSSSSLGLLELKGTRVAVSGPVTVDDTGLISNHVMGSSCGIDLQSSDTNDLTVLADGEIHLSFESGPSDVYSSYWGFRMQGDNVAELQTYIDDTKMTYDVSALPAGVQSKFGIYYSQSDDTTYIGFEPSKGTLIMMW